MNFFKKKKMLAAASLMCCALLLAGCAAGNETTSESSDVSEASASTTDNVSVTEINYNTLDDDDLNDSWDDSATMISLSGSSAEIDGEGASSNGSTVSITKAGTYVLSGTYTGTIEVNASEAAVIRIILNNAEIKGDTNSAIYVKAAKKVVVTVYEGTTNSLEDADDFTTDSDGDPDATLYSEVDLTLNGTGELNITSLNANGITTKDDLILVNGNITVNAANNGIKGRDSITAVDGVYNITAGNDGIYSNNESEGWIVISAGEYNITSANDGIQAETMLEISGGTFNIDSGNTDNIDTMNNSGSSDSFGEMGGFGGGNSNFSGERPERGSSSSEATDEATVAETESVSVTPVSTTDSSSQAQEDSSEESSSSETTDTTQTESTSYKGIKSGGNMTISGGTFTINSEDDSIHSNGSVTITSGTFTINAGDDGIHADDALVISDGTIDIQRSYEGLEGATVTISGGTIDVVATDDGINAAGGSDGNSGGFGADSFSASGDYWILIEGGEIHINASADGLDSNGNITMTGGSVTIDGPTSGGDGALDYDGTFLMNGGTLYAAGSSAMAMGTSSDSTQPALMVSFTTTIEAGSTIELKDSSGNTVASFTNAKSIQNIVISTPDMVDGESYTLYINGEEQSTVTLSGYLTGVDETGAEASTGNAMGMGSGMMSENQGEMPTMGDFDGSMPEGMDGEMPNMEDFDGTMPEGGPGGQNGTQSSEESSQATE